VAYGLAPRVYQSSKDIQPISWGHHHTVALSEPIRHQARVLHDQHAYYLALGPLPPSHIRSILHDSLRCSSNPLSFLDRRPLLPDLLMPLPCLLQPPDQRPDLVPLIVLPVREGRTLRTDPLDGLKGLAV